MFCNHYRTKDKPKILRAIEESVFNNAPPPPELLEYKYRKMFGLSAIEFAQEPIDTFYTNLFIHAQIAEKQRIEAKNG